MIESKLKANNCNRGQLFRPCWVRRSRQHGAASYEVFTWSTDIHILTKMVPIGQCHMQNACRGTIGKIQNIMSLTR